MSSVVATGRRINKREGLMNLPLLEQSGPSLVYLSQVYLNQVYLNQAYLNQSYPNQRSPGRPRVPRG
jgi:hypothetical protein